MRAFLTILVCVFVATPCQARIIYVDDDGLADFSGIQ